MSMEVLPHIFKEHTAWRVYKGIPPGAICKGWTIDPHNQILNLFIEHESFDLCDIHSVFPDYTLEFIAIK